MKKIYISGQITNLAFLDSFALFEQAEKELTKKGFEVINPMTIEHDHDLSWLNYMRTDIKVLVDCDVIYMLSNWTNSKGAEIERKLAIDLGIDVMYEFSE